MGSSNSAGDGFGFPLDWDELQEKTLHRDRHRCRECGRATELFVLFDEHPDAHGYGIGNLTTLCWPCCPSVARMSKTAIQSSFRDAWVQQEMNE